MDYSNSHWLLSKKDTAKVFGIAVQSFDGWISRGCPVHEQDSRGRVKSFHLLEVIKWHMDRETVDSEDGTLNPAAERARKDKEAADKLAMENQVTRCELLPVDQVADLWVRVLMDCKTALLALPSKLAPVVIGKTREQARFELERSIHDALRGLAETRYVEGEGHDASAETDSQRMGGSGEKAESGGERGAGAVEHQ